MIARFENILTIYTLKGEEHVLWLDADVKRLSNRVIQTMLAHSSFNTAAAMIAARYQEGPTNDYDKNAWAVAALSIGLDREGYSTKRSGTHLWHILE